MSMWVIHVKLWSEKKVNSIKQQRTPTSPIRDQDFTLFHASPSKHPLWRSGVWLYLWRGTAWLLVALAVTGAALAVRVRLGAALGLTGAPGAATGMGQAGCVCCWHGQAAVGRRASRVSMLLVFFKVSPWGELLSEPSSHWLSAVSTPPLFLEFPLNQYRPSESSSISTKGAHWVYASRNILIMVLITSPSPSPLNEKHFSVTSLSLLAQWLQILTITLQ